MVTRVVHCKREPYDIYIGRGVGPLGPKSPREGMWGNPYTHTFSPYVEDMNIVASREEAILKYEEYMRACLRDETVCYYTNQFIGPRDVLELKDKVLGCWCAPLPCHGDILIKLIKEYKNYYSVTEKEAIKRNG